jgi:molybdopterin synthase catalytic subunit
MPRLVDAEIDTSALLRAVVRPECGAAILFVGTTRQFTDGHETASLDYEAYYDMALAEMARLEKEACDRFEIVQCLIEHRLGNVTVGETSVAVAVSSPHRKAAFAAAEWVMDQLKARVPIWKKDRSPTGERWIPNAKPENESDKLNAR